MSRKPIAFDLDQVEALAQRGLTEEQIASALGISQATITRRKKDNDDFVAALKRGRAKGIAFVTNKLMENVKAGKEASIFFYLKTQAGWKETSVQELAGRDGGPIEQSLTVEFIKP